MEEEFLTVLEAAERVGKHENAIRSAIARGRLPFTNHYGKKLVAVKDLEEYARTARKGRPAGADAPSAQ